MDEEESSLQRLFKVRDVTKILSDPPPPLVDIIKPGILWKGGKLLLSAPKKSGKSAIVQQLAFALAGYCPIFSPLHTTGKHKVLYVQFEMHEQIVRERLIAAGWDPDPNDIYIASMPYLKLDKDNIFQAFKLMVKEVNPDVLILDPLYNIHNQDENDAGKMQVVFDRLDELIKELDIAIILVHHHRKEYAGPGGDMTSPESRSRGTSKLQDWPDTLVTIEADRKADTRTLIFICRRNPDMPPITMKFDPNTWTYTTINGKEDVDKYILDSCPIDRQELIESLWTDMDVDPSEAANAIRRLTRADKIELVRGEGQGRPTSIRRTDVEHMS